MAAPVKRALPAVLLLSCLALPAFAQRGEALVEQAAKQLDDLDADGAVKSLYEAERQSGNTRQTLERLYLLRGMAFGTLDKPQMVRDAFRRLLILNPGAKLPEDQPPRVQTPFLEARAWADGKLLTFTPAAESEDGAVKWLLVRAANDVLRLAKTVRFNVDGQSFTTAFKGPEARLAVPGPSASWWAEVLTEHGALLERIASPEEPRVDGASQEVATVKELIVTQAPEPGGQWRRPLGGVLLGVGAAAAGVGVVFGVLSRDAREKVTGAQTDGAGRVTGITQREAAEYEAQAQTNAILANALFIGGGALAAAGLVFIIVGPDSAPVATLTPAPGGLVLNGRF